MNTGIPASHSPAGLAQRIEFPAYGAHNGKLTVFEGRGTVPFEIRRVFSVVAGRGANRGAHAHHRCTQLLVCLSGRVRLTCFDGAATEHNDLEPGGVGILVPPGVWATQEYLEDSSVVIVFCDREFEPDDYIRDYQEFLGVKAAKK